MLNGSLAEALLVAVARYRCSNDKNLFVVRVPSASSSQLKVADQLVKVLCERVDAGCPERLHASRIELISLLTRSTRRFPLPAKIKTAGRS